MKFVFASDSFKGSLSSSEICAILREAAVEAFPEAECVCLPMADGGEGTLDAIKSVKDGEEVQLYVFDALKRRMRTSLFISNEEAFIEAATTCGLARTSPADLDPLAATSNGVGAFISHALFHGCKRIAVALGGTCTNDGGMGCLRALGVRFFDRDGNELSGSGADLARVASIDESELFPQARNAQITVLSDVTNPLLGDLGATRVFARQKGADDITEERLESGMLNFADAIRRTHPDVDFNTPGFGAAGGLGMALSVFLNAHIQSGADYMLDLLDFDTVVKGAQLVITGEGKLDAQSLHGKVPGAVLARAQKTNVAVAALCGSVALTPEQVRKLCFSDVRETSTGVPLEEALSNASDLYRSAARKLFSDLAASGQNASSR